MVPNLTHAPPQHFLMVAAVAFLPAVWADFFSSERFKTYRICWLRNKIPASHRRLTRQAFVFPRRASIRLPIICLGPVILVMHHVARR